MKDIRISRAAREEGGQFRFVGSSREKNRAKARRLFSVVRENDVPTEPPSKGGTWKWKKKKTRKFKFVDDGSFLTKLNMVNDYEIPPGKENLRLKRDIQTENLFKRTIGRATAQGMKVNVDKTAMLTVSAANSYTPVAYIEDGAGGRIIGDDESLKIVGFHFSNRPTAALHVKETVSKVRRRFWILRHLKRNGLTNEELTRVYTTNIRSCIEYASVVYGALITKEQGEDLERLQRQCLKIIHGFDKSYSCLLELTGLSTLEERRQTAMLKFADKCIDGNYAHWFPLNQNTGRTRRSLEFKESFARCDRLRNSPIYYMRRLLNSRNQQ